MSLRPVADRPTIDPRLAALLERAGDRVLVFGSFHTVAEAMRALGSEGG